MSVTDILDRSEKLGEAILNSMMEKDCESCGCERCKRILEGLSELTDQESIK